MIHGPNGVGKTKISTWIATLLRRDVSVFAPHAVLRALP
jgi:Holliday junction resolvasome RuvABC ATP-dependent DNA helicase subunit